MSFLSSITVPRRGLYKNDHTDGRVVVEDSSSILSLGSGCVEIHMYLPHSIKNGKYSICDNRKYFTDYLLFAVNPVGHFISPPGIYAALTPDGIEFSMWTSAGKYSIVDSSTNIGAMEPFVVSFCWNGGGNFMGSGATMGIFINNECTASANYPISSDSLVDVVAVVLDTSDVYYNLECVLFDFITYSSVPYSLYDKVGSLSRHYFGESYLAMLYSDGMRVIYVDPSDGIITVDHISSITVGNNSLAVSDSDKGIYVMSAIGYDDSSSSVVYVDGKTGEVGEKYIGLNFPVAIAVTQLGGIEFPRNGSAERCRHVWICESDEVIKCNGYLVEQGRRGGYVGIVDILPLSDGRAWVIDKGNSYVHLLSSNMLYHEISISVGSPEMGGINIFNDLYVYDSTLGRIIKYTNGDDVNSAILPSDPVSMDVRAVDGYVVVSFEDGTVSVYDGVLNLVSSWSPAESSPTVLFRRGYGRNTIYVIDDAFGIVYEKNIYGTTINSYNVGEGNFLGSSSCLANNNSVFYSDINIDASFDSSDGTIVDVETDFYKVDSITIDMTGGGNNDSIYREFGIDRNSPMDRKRNIIKGARIS